MNEFNPIIGNTPHETLDVMIDVLQLNITLLSRFSDVADEDILTIGLTQGDGDPGVFFYGDPFHIEPVKKARINSRLRLSFRVMA